MTPVKLVVAMYELPNYGGRKIVLYGDTSNLSTYGFNNLASSVIISKGPNYVATENNKVSFYDSASYAGAQLALGVGMYPDLAKPYNFDNIISSVNSFQDIPVPGL